MLRDEEAERLLLEAQQLALVVLLGRDPRVVSLRGGLLLLDSEAEVEDRALAGEPVGMLAAAERERLVEHIEHALAGGAGRVERAALDERLERAAVHDLRVDALGEVPNGGERAGLARGDDRTAGALADVLDGV